MHPLSAHITSISDAYRLWNHRPDENLHTDTSDPVGEALAVVPHHLCPQHVTFSEAFPLVQVAIFPVSLTVPGGGQRYSVLLHHRTGHVSAVTLWSNMLRLSQLVRLAHTFTRAHHVLYLTPGALQSLNEERTEFSAELLERWHDPAAEIVKAAASLGVPGTHLEVMQSAINGLSQSVLVLFDTLLEPGAAACAIPRSAATAHAYCYYASNDLTLRRNRQQAANAYPFMRQLLPLMASMDIRGGSKEVDYQDVANVVEVGESLSSALMSALNLTQDGLRHLQINAPSFTTQAELEAAARMVRCIPKEDRPQNQEDWDAARKIMAVLPSANQDRFFRLIRNPSLIGKLNRALAEIDELWWPQIARMVRAQGWGPTALRLSDLQLGHIDEFAQSALVATRSGRTIDFELALVLLRTLLGDTSLKELIEIDQTWKWMLRNEEGETSHVRHWPFITRRPITIEQFVIQPLLSPQMLAAEGRKLAHCAATFAAAASCGESFLFSLCGRDEKNRSTLELALENELLVDAEISNSAPKFRIVQHLGPENRAVSAHEQAIARSFVEKLNSGEWDVTPEGFWRRLRRCRAVDFSRHHKKRTARSYTIDRIPKAKSMMSHLRSLHGTAGSRR